MKLIFSFFFSVFFCYLNGQTKDTIRVKLLHEVKVEKDFIKKYNKTLRRVRKVYPLALYAAEKIKEIDAEIENQKSNRKKKKIAKHEHKDLKDDFYYVIRDLYIEEGKLLMKLIHRETGMTVSEIIKKYRGNFKAGFNETLGKIWEQDLDSKYDPEGEDWIVEQIIQEIKNEQIKFDFEPKILSKEEYKEIQKQYKIDKKALKKLLKENRKQEKEKKK